MRGFMRSPCRSLKDLITRITELETRKIGFKSLTEQIDTTTSGGKLIFHIFGALAEFERDIIKERTNAGLTAARIRGKLNHVQFETDGRSLGCTSSYSHIANSA
jgi:DNA invertase Pin-like site-specific DNA recombinase